MLLLLKIFYWQNSSKEMNNKMLLHSNYVNDEFEIRQNFYWQNRSKEINNKMLIHIYADVA